MITSTQVEKIKDVVLEIEPGRNDGAKGECLPVSFDCLSGSLLIHRSGRMGHVLQRLSDGIALKTVPFLMSLYHLRMTLKLSVAAQRLLRIINGAVCWNSKALLEQNLNAGTRKE